MFGPWGRLFSRITQVLIEEPTPQKFLVIADETTDYEAYNGVIDEEDKT